MNYTVNDNSGKNELMMIMFCCHDVSVGCKVDPKKFGTQSENSK